MSEPIPPPTFPRRCTSNAFFGEAWCIGIFNGMIDFNGNPQFGNPNAQPGPIALVERRNGEQIWLEEVGTRWLRFVE